MTPIFSRLVPFVRWQYGSHSIMSSLSKSEGESSSELPGHLGIGVFSLSSPDQFKVISIEESSEMHYLA